MAYFDVSDFFFVPVLQLGEGQFYLWGDLCWRILFMG
ncbi:uncharacterized protein METZ01_LOCUS508126 [marine metagenome]|uniref:Uncharacterized protein n=1 Tax=marine metagenome TaxID=408172 RepID=A0A383EEI0_9ZZZZ